ncbi:MAG: CapA family protein [Treponemataceae bacterium]|nr:CapA family protein [Treponemataceae bacterium]
MTRFGLRTAALFFPALLCIACASTRIAAPDEPADDTAGTISADVPEDDTITLLFAGDIMAHADNYEAGNFPAIWTDVAPVIAAADLAFANVEAPVADRLPWSTYPQFNMHTPYIDAAIDAGFDVFSLANNHTNDKGLDGMQQTLAYFSGKKDVYSCGIKATADAPLTYQVIRKNGWTILFVAFTEIVNARNDARYFDYIPPQGKLHDTILADLKRLRAEHPCDVFVVSVHANEPEYVRSVAAYQRQFYHDLIAQADADIVWSNHAHVVKDWEIVPADKKTRGGLIMYANGNTISGQRTDPQFGNPGYARDYTGDGLLMTVTLRRTSATDGRQTLTVEKLAPQFITTYIAPDRQFVLRLLDDDLIHSLRRAGLDEWATYLAERKALMENIKETSIWQ